MRETLVREVACMFRSYLKGVHRTPQLTFVITGYLPVRDLDVSALTSLVLIVSANLEQ